MGNGPADKSFSYPYFYVYFTLGVPITGAVCQPLKSGFLYYTYWFTSTCVFVILLFETVD